MFFDKMKAKFSNDRFGINLVTGIRSNMKNKLMPLYDRLLLRKRSVIETINDELKNVAQLVHSRHRSIFNFAMNVLSAIAAYSFFEKKPAVNIRDNLHYSKVICFIIIVRPNQKIEPKKVL